MSTAGTSLTSQRPYLLRALHEWMADNDLTPHIVVDARAQGLRAPAGHDADGKLVLNVSYAATRGLSLGNEAICFEARFGGIPHQVSVPVEAVLGIYARETGQGMLFAAEENGPSDPDSGPAPAGPGPQPGGSSPQRDKTSRPTLKIVK